jgi:hypothetical protein
MAGCWQRIFSGGEPWDRKLQDKRESSLQEQSVDRILRRIEDTGNIELVIDALEIVEHDGEAGSIHEAYRPWQGTKEAGLLDELIEALGARRLQRED